jgi:hypothetical protein
VKKFRLPIVLAAGLLLASAAAIFALPKWDSRNERMEEKVEEEKRPFVKKLNIRRPDGMPNPFLPFQKDFKPEHLQSAVQTAEENGRIRLDISVQNISPAPVRLQFPTSQRYDFLIFGEKGEPLYRWSEGKAFLQVINEVELEAGGRLSFTAYWDGKRKNGKKAEKGKYLVKVIITAKAKTSEGKTVDSRELSATGRFSLP